MLIKYLYKVSECSTAEDRSQPCTWQRTFLYIACVREEGLQEKQVWDPNTQRKRRKAVFTEEEGEDDVSGDSDDEDGDSEDSDQDEQEEDEDEDEDNLSTFLKEARAKSDKTEKNVADSAPPVKKQKVEERKEESEMPAFADSEDELERSQEEGGAGRAGDSGHCSEEDEEDSDGEEEEEEEDDDEAEDDDDTTGKKQTASEEEEEDEQGLYFRYNLQLRLLDYYRYHNHHCLDQNTLFWFLFKYLKSSWGCYSPISVIFFLFFTLNLYSSFMFFLSFQCCFYLIV